MPHLPRLICEECAQRLASFDAGALDVSPAVRVVVPPVAPGQDVAIVLICRCGARRPWAPRGYEVKAGGLPAARR